MKLIDKSETRRGLSWIAGSWSLLRKDGLLWLGMTFIYMLIAVALKMIPFVGVLVLVLLSPILLAGVLDTAHGLEAPAPEAEESGDQPRPNFLKRAMRQLFCAFSRQEEVLPIMVISTLTLGAVVAIQILAQLLKVGGPALSAMIAGSVGPAVWLPAMLSLLVVLVLQILLGMAIFYAVPLVLFKKEPPLSAMEKSFRACVDNAGALIVFAIPFAIVNTAVDLLYFDLDFPQDYLVLFVLGFVTLPFFVGGLYRSYEDAFG